MGVRLCTGTSSYLRVRGLHDEKTGAKIGDATVRATLMASLNGGVVGGVDNVELPVVDAAQGDYEYKIPGAGFNPPPSAGYLAKIVMTRGADVRERWEPVSVERDT